MTGETRDWTFLSNHGHVLVCVAQQPEMRIRDIADEVGLTERAASSILADLEHEGFLTRTKVGRNNHYDLHTAKALRHPIERHCTIGTFLEAMTTRQDRKPAETRRRAR